MFWHSSVWISNTKPEIDRQTLKHDGKQTFWWFWCQLHFYFQPKFDAYPTLELDINQMGVCNTFSPPLVSKHFLDVTLTSRASWDWSYLDFYSHTMRVMRKFEFIFCLRAWCLGKSKHSLRHLDFFRNSGGNFFSQVKFKMKVSLYT